MYMHNHLQTVDGYGTCVLRRVTIHLVHVLNMCLTLLEHKFSIVLLHLFNYTIICTGTLLRCYVMYLSCMDISIMREDWNIPFAFTVD